MKSIRHTYKPVKFFLAANIMMWAFWMMAAYLSYRPGSSPKLISALELIGLLSPVSAALWLIFTSGSAELKKDFYRKLFNIRLISPSSIPAIFLIMPAVVAVSVVISHLLFSQPLSQLNIVKGSPFAAGIVPAQLLIFLAPLVEETGWKGYGMDSLRGGRSFLKATIIYGALWAFWHIPLFFVNNYYHNMILRENPLFALNFFISVFAGAVIINWLWYKNKGSILTAVFFHAVINFQGVLQMGQIAKCIETAIMVIVAIAVVMLNRKMFFGAFSPEVGNFVNQE